MFIFVKDFTLKDLKKNVNLRLEICLNDLNPFLERF